MLYLIVMLNIFQIINVVGLKLKYTSELPDDVNNFIAGSLLHVLRASYKRPVKSEINCILL